jgi:taurine dioxygenase
MAIAITPLTDSIGAEVTGVDLSRDLDEATRRTLYKAWVDNVVLVFHDQSLSPPDFIKAARNFGAPMRQNLESFDVPGFPDIGVVSNRDKDTTQDGKRDGKAYVRGVSWHSDHSYAETPPKATILYGIDIPSSGGDTQFCNMRAAYEALPAETRQRIDGLKVLHVYQSSRSPRKLIGRTAAEESLYPGNVVHPLVRTNPDTGRKGIYHNPVRVERILDIDAAESDALLERLTRHATQPCFQYRHKWRPGDMVIWDNRNAMHQANADYDMREKRFLHRIMLEGERPV